MNIIVIPDVHGRGFWRDAVGGHENDRIIFLGDYLDPYGWEGITPDDAWNEFLAILEFKRKHPDNVTLLLGNHDLGYLDRRICQVRMDHPNFLRNHSAFERDLSLFDIACEENFDGRKLLFSHAGFRHGWVRRHPELFLDHGAFTFSPILLNEMLHDPVRISDLMNALRDRSWHRGGNDEAGSPIWADISEFEIHHDPERGYLQVVGHSLNYRGPVMLGKKVICLDCCMAFRIGEGLSFEEIF